MRRSRQLTHLRYRPDVDGLRTIAVLPVVLFHAGVAGFAGGYVGVDVFFVISGYLITGILLAEMKDGTYRIGRFYDRRIRRIFPALALVVAATLAAGAVVLAPATLVDVGRSALAVGAFASNFFFWRSVDYFGNAHAAQPLLHTWSLAVEEQFYIVFPPLLAVMARRRWPIVPVLAGVAALSLLAAALMVFVKPSATFYLPVTRAWELLVGSLLAAGVPRYLPAGRTREGLGALGMALILVPVALYDARTPFPGLAAMPPVLGAALILWTGGGPATAVGRVLSAPPMVFVGKLSYSLYLWHVPVFAYAVYLLGGSLSVPVSLALTGLSLLLAWATYRWVETPFRRGSPRWLGRAWIAGAAAMVAVVAVAGGLVVSQGWPGRLDERARVLVDTAADKSRFRADCMSVGEIVVPPANACLLGTPGRPPSALLWGDSHAMVTAAPMEAAARARGRAFLFAAAADCPVGLDFSIDDGTVPALTRMAAYRFCGDYNRQMLALALSQPSIRSVVLSSRWTNWRLGEPGNLAEDPVDIRLRDAGGVAASPAANAAIFERGFLRLVAALRAGGKQVFVVGPLPEPDFNVPDRLFVERFGGIEPAGPIPVARYAGRHRRILVFFEGLQRRGEVTFIWPATMLCGRDVCPIETRGHPNFFDQDHLSLRAARATAPLYAAVFP